MRATRKGSKLMKNILLFAVFAVALPSWAEVRCRTLLPDPAALETCIREFESSKRSKIVATKVAAQETQTDVVDILVGYDASAQNWLTANQKGTPESFAKARIDEMNAVLANTGLAMLFHFRLAGVVLVNVDASDPQLDRTLTSHLVDSKGNVMHKSGEWAKLATQRESLGADIVTFWVNAPDIGMIGIGYSLEDSPGAIYSDNPKNIKGFGNWAYNVCGIANVEKDYTALHEIAHNMGCGHPDSSLVDPYSVPPGPQLYSYSSGFYFTAGGQAYNTIMAYSFDGKGGEYENAPVFSSSSHTYLGAAVGDAAHDNTRTLRETYSYVAQYRISKLSPSPDSDSDPTPVPSPLPDGMRALYSEIGGVVPNATASEYNGYVVDTSGNVKGTIQVKLGKSNANTGLAAVKATVQIGGTKKNLKGADGGKAAISAMGPTSMMLVGGENCTITLGAKGVVGTYGSLLIDGARNFFSSKDKGDQNDANTVLGKWLGPVNIVWDGGSINVSLAKKGKVKVSGTLADGKTKVSASALFIVGEEWCAVPVAAPKANLAFTLWLSSDGRTAMVEGLGDDVRVGRAGSLVAGSRFSIYATSASWSQIPGQVLTNYLPEGVSVTQKGTKWVLPKAGKITMKKGEIDDSKKGDNPSGLKLTYKAKDGSFKGSFKVYAELNGKLKATTVNVTGVVVDGKGYGSATGKNVVTFGVDIMPDKDRKR